MTRRDSSSNRTRTINSLTEPVRTIDFGVDAQRPLSIAQIRTVSVWRARSEGVAIANPRARATRQAGRILQPNEALAANRVTVTGPVTQQAPELLEMTGIGAAFAATVLVSWYYADLSDESTRGLAYGMRFIYSAQIFGLVMVRVREESHARRLVAVEIGSAGASSSRP